MTERGDKVTDVKDAESHRYDDIIDLPHYEPKNHPRMSRLARAAQFSPFAALTGFDGYISEEGRLTDRRCELDENEKSFLDVKLRILEDLPGDTPEVTFTLFIPDKTKSGGKYVTRTGKFKKIDRDREKIILEDGTSFPVGDVCDVDSGIFRQGEID